MTRLLHFALPLLFAVFVGFSYHYDWFYALDLLLYDEAQKSLEIDPPDDIVVITIDEQSLQSLGRWPWSRRVHAELLDVLTEAQVKAIVFDIIFAEADTNDPESDARFAQALENNARTLLPLHIEPLRYKGQLLEIHPFPKLAQSTAATGHAHLDCDYDGVCRSVHLHVGLEQARLPHLALSLYQLIGESHLEIPGRRSANHAKGSPFQIYQDYHNFIPFSANENLLQKASYVDVLTGQIPKSFFQDKIIFIGATNPGLDDILVTPVGRIPGVEIHAQIYNALRNNSFISSPERYLIILLLVPLVFACLFGFTFLSPFQLLLANAATAFLLLKLAQLSIVKWHFWLPVAPVVVTIICFYPLWNWFRLEMALRYLKRALAKSHDEASLFQSSTQGGARSPDKSDSISRFSVDIVGKTLDKLARTNRDVDYSRQLIRVSLSELQDAVGIFNHEGELILLNKKFELFFPDWHEQDNQGGSSAKTLKTLSNLDEQIALDEHRSWKRYIDQLVQHGEAFEVEATAQYEQRAILLHARSVSLHDKQHEQLLNDIIVLSITDLSLVKERERSRVETFNFISHDLRSPLISILALIEKLRPSEIPINSTVQKTIDDIEVYVKTNLNYTESLLQLGKAENIPSSAFHFCDLHAIADDALIQVHTLANTKSIKVMTNKEDCDIWAWGDGDLLTRALVNLLSNAIKYSPAQTQVKLSLKRIQTQARFCIEDQGYGIASEDIPKLFQRFKRGEQGHGESGAGLGLYFVKTVAEKHKGKVGVLSSSEQGSVFELSLPLYDLPTDA
ncbi:MAG: hypothetical protein COA42_08020 [Alteromonadaceae bacterium]|nr:MAG: hypothetical protein COA42_08020 [Alteromonadaceae bacterium]